MMMLQVFVLMNLRQNSNKKIKGKSAYNLAVVYNIKGDCKNAFFWAQKAMQNSIKNQVNNLYYLMRGLKMRRG